MNVHINLFKMGGLFLLIALLIVGAWAVDNNKNDSTLTTTDFNPNRPSEIPDPSIIDFQIDGISEVGQVLMVEGLENETTPGGEDGVMITRFPRLIVHGIFDRTIRDWREDVMEGRPSPRDIDIILRDSNNTRRLQIEIFDAWPATFSFPVLSEDGSTRYLERIEFVYDHFEIVD